MEWFAIGVDEKTTCNKEEKLKYPKWIKAQNIVKKKGSDSLEM